MTVSLFITCLGGHAVSGNWARRGAVAGAARAGGRVPRGADLLRPDALQHRLLGRGPGAGQPLRARVRRRRGGGVAVGLLRGHGARALLTGAGRPRVRAVAVPGRAARRGGRGRLLPAPGHLPPHLPLAAGAAGGRRSAAPAARGARDRPRGTAGGGGVLRLRRHVRGEEPGRVRRDAHGQDHARARYERGGVHSRRQLLPDAHRRRAVAPARRRAHGAPGGDPGLDGRPARPRAPARAAAPAAGARARGTPRRRRRRGSGGRRSA